MDSPAYKVPSISRGPCTPGCCQLSMRRVARPKPEPGSKTGGMGSAHRTRPGALCTPGPRPVPQLFGHHHNCDRPGKGLASDPLAGHWEAAVPEAPFPGPAGSIEGHSAASTPTRCLCRTRSRDRKRQAPNAKQPRRLGRRPFPPLLFLPAATADAILKPPGLCP